MAAPRKPSPKPPARLRLLGYLRCSSDEQQRSGLGLEAQEAALLRWCHAAGHELVGVVSDEGVSGFRAPHQRPAFRSAVEQLEAGAADGLVALELSRFARNTQAWLALRERFRKQRWALALASSGLLPQRETAEDTFTGTVMAAVAQHYRDFVAQKTREAHAMIRDGNRSPSRMVRFGFRTETSAGGVMVAGDRSELVPHPEEYPQLQQLLALRRKGLGARRIARALGTNARTGKPWRPRTVESVLMTHAAWEGA